MSTFKTKKNIENKRRLSLAILYAFVLLSIFSVAAEADPAPPVAFPGGPSNGDVNDNVYNPGYAQAPAVGSGNTPQPVDQGDLGPALNPATGVADPTTGSIDGTQVGQDRTIVRLYVNGQQVQTIRPDQLTDAQIQSIDGILGINMLSGKQEMKAVCTADMIYQIQQVLYAYPANTIISGKQKIVSDPAPQWITDPAGNRYHNPNGGGISQQSQGLHSAWDYIGRLPTVRVFCRWLVTAGVVAATVWMASGAMSVAAGHPMAGMRVMQTILGLMVLVSGFTIYKVVQMNVWNATYVEKDPTLHDRAHQALVDPQYVTAPDVPGTPAAPATRPQRDGIPVAPLSEPTYQ